MRSIRHHALSLALLLSAASCTQAPPSSTGNGLDPAASGTDPAASEWTSGPVRRGNDAGTSASTSGDGGTGQTAPRPPETCDGFDNDVDGLIDEGTGGGECRDAAGQDGTLECEGGQLVCRRCTPGTTRREACGCGIDRVDVCSTDGTWKRGACDGCQAQEGSCGECTPGEQVVQRCDTCSGESCGTTCAGATFVCNANCRFDQVSSCESKQPVCNRDQVIYEPCGLCGTRRVVCDGCFWHREPCEGEGVCRPSATRVVPCFEQSCAEGHTATIECNERCEWNAPTACTGCSPGVVNRTETPCVPGYPRCGAVIQETVCRLGPPVESCEAQPRIRTGELMTETMGECTLDCMPGQRGEQPCTLGDGRAGVQSRVCGDDCRWSGFGGCGATAGSCVPNTVEVTPVTCGSGACAGSYERVRTCEPDGDGWQTTRRNSTCRECSEGDVTQVRCTTARGECGSRPAQCNAGTCTFGAPTGECIPSPNSCVPGTQVRETRSCGGAGCNANYTVTRTCRTDGCGWNEQEDRSNCPTCAPGEIESVSCRTPDNRCGTRQRECTAGACTWGGWSACQPLPNACPEGAVEDRPCSGACGSSGTERWECRECQWTKTRSCNARPPCEPGTRENLGECVPGIPRCGNRERTCDVNCTWVDTGCPPCG